MVPPWESTALLAVVATVIAERGLGVRLGIAVDCLVATFGAVTYAADVRLSAVTAAGWLVAAAVAGDQVARLAGRPSGRDPFGLLRRTRSGGAYALASLGGGVLWSAGLVLTGRLLIAAYLRW
jgi:membrane protein DedA with SNARE-associated domain